MAIISEKGHWNKHEVHGKVNWAIERSLLQAYDEWSCPVCSHPIYSGYPSGQLTPVRDKEGDLTHWKGTCCCGTQLIIFND